VELHSGRRCGQRGGRIGALRGPHGKCTQGEEAELALGDAFDRLACNNFLLDQGMLPPDMLAEAVRGDFIPAQR